LGSHEPVWSLRKVPLWRGARFGLAFSLKVAVSDFLWLFLRPDQFWRKKEVGGGLEEGAVSGIPSYPLSFVAEATRLLRMRSACGRPFLGRFWCFPKVINSGFARGGGAKRFPDPLLSQNLKALWVGHVLDHA
jgi:hypothetical protein